MTEIDTETVIIGGGQTGVPLARVLTAEGRPVILIERASRLLLREFRPPRASKAVIACARLAADARKPRASAFSFPRSRWTFEAMMDRARE